MSPGREPDFEVDGEVTAEQKLRAERRASDPGVSPVIRDVDQAAETVSRLLRRHGAITFILVVSALYYVYSGWADRHEKQLDREERREYTRAVISAIEKVGEQNDKTSAQVGHQMERFSDSQATGNSRLENIQTILELNLREKLHGPPPEKPPPPKRVRLQ